MPFPVYANTGPVDCDVSPDLSTLKDKSVVITGGANGLGEQYVRAFAGAGAYVTFGDIDESKGEQIKGELGPNVQYFKCDTTSWSDQLGMFKAAVAHSPAKSCDVVIANAGIGGPDEIYNLEDPTQDPTKPQLRILDVDLNGVLYTLKLAQHYFRAQPESPARDRCFIFKGSVAGLLDLPSAWQYSAAKFALRGLMRSARRTSWQHGIRVNYVAPWYTKTEIMSAAAAAQLEASGVEFSLAADCAAAMLRIATDKRINGRTLAVLPRSHVPRGFADAQLDDHAPGTYFEALQQTVLDSSTATKARPSEQ